MDDTINSNIIEKLQEENKQLKDEITTLKEKLKKYTNPSRNKDYYKKNRNKIIQQNKNYRMKTGYKISKEKQHEYYERYKLKKLNKNKD